MTRGAALLDSAAARTVELRIMTNKKIRDCREFHTLEQRRDVIVGRQIFERHTRKVGQRCLYKSLRRVTGLNKASGFL